MKTTFHEKDVFQPVQVKCLIVDDLQENLLALSALLKQDNVDILTARSGTEALELLLVHDVALAFLDIQMPEMDGFELAELLRGSERTRHIPLIFMTAGSQDKHRLFKGYETGAVDFLYKPIEPHILKNKADVFFQLYRHKQRLAQELHQKTETLRLNEMFMAVLGHDLRNPLNAILTGAHLLHHCPNNEDVVKKTSAIMLSSGEWMNRMIKDMLDLAQARLAGGIPIKYELFDLGELIERVVQEHRASFPERDIHMQLAGDLKGEWDADRLAQVASNLIGNALQHGDGGEIQIMLEGENNDNVILSVTNKGSIPAAILPHIFNPFRSSRDQTNKNSGLGLGLYIVEQIVKAHLGSINVNINNDNHQTTFRVHVPRRV